MESVGGAQELVYLRADTGKVQLLRRIFVLRVEHAHVRETFFRRSDLVQCRRGIDRAGRLRLDRQHRHHAVFDFGETAGEQKLVVAGLAQFQRQDARHQRGDEVGVKGQHAKLTEGADRGNLLDSAVEEDTGRGDELELEGIGHREAPALARFAARETLGLGAGVVDRADEIEGLLGQVIALAVEDLLEAADGLGA
jgi:hypothetical protein